MTDNIASFDAVKAAAECMQWPTIAEAVRNYHNDNGFAETVFKLIHDDYTLAQAVEICDVLLKRGKYAEATIEIERAPESLIGKRVQIDNEDLPEYEQEGKVVGDLLDGTYAILIDGTETPKDFYYGIEFCLIDIPAAPVIPQPLAEIDALNERVKELEAELKRVRQTNTDLRRAANDVLQLAHVDWRAADLDFSWAYGCLEKLVS